MVAGDPKQFGPIVKSPLALQHGMGKTAHRDTDIQCVYSTVIRRTDMHNYACRKVSSGALDDQFSTVPEGAWQVQQTLHHKTTAQLQVLLQN